MPSSEESLQYAQAVLEEFFPTRATAMVRVLRQRNERFATIEPWREDQVAGFIALINLAGMDLRRGYADKHLPLLGWATMSLLELSIWINYCEASDENARQFAEFADSDIKAFERGEENTATVPDAKANGLMSYATTTGVTDLAGDAGRVTEAAEKIGKGDYLKARKMLYSKFAHPTALAVKSAVSPEIEQRYRNMLFIDGAELAFQCLNAIRTYILNIFPGGIKMWPLE